MSTQYIRYPSTGGGGASGTAGEVAYFDSATTITSDSGLLYSGGILSSATYKSLGTNPASAGVVRLANLESVAWRNAANSDDVLLSVRSDNSLKISGGVAAGSDQIVFLQHSDNTSGNSDAYYLAQVGGTSAGDPFIKFDIPGGTSWSVGADNSASDGFSITNAANLGGAAQFFTIDTNGKVTLGVSGGTQTHTANGNLSVTGTVTGTSFISATANPASTGSVRLANTEGLFFRNVGNTADISLVLNNANTLFLDGTTFAVENSTASATVGTRVVHNDNTSGTSNARFYALSGGASGGDAFFRASIASATDWSFGCDNSDTDAFVLCQAATLSTTSLLRVAKTWQSGGNDPYRWYYSNTAPTTGGNYIASFYDTVTQASASVSDIYSVSSLVSGGYTAAGQLFGFHSVITAAGTGINPSLVKMNAAYSGLTIGTTTGMNVAFRGRVQNGDVSVSGFFTTETVKNNAKYFGVIGTAKNANSGANAVGVFATLRSETDFSSASDFPSVSAALLADNWTSGLDIANFRDNGTNAIRIRSGGNQTFEILGKGISFKEGSNARMGQSVLVAGTVTVSNTSVTASSRIFLTNAITGGTVGVLSVGTITAATSFVINSSSVLDTSTVNWVIFEPS